MRRREFMTLLIGAAMGDPRAAIAQSSSKVYRLGTLQPGMPLTEKTPLGLILLQRLEERGYAIGKNLSLDARGAAGQVSKLPELARGMKVDKIDVIVAVGFPTALACKVENIPTVVAYGAGDPVATHLVDGLSRPGGNITGISDNAATLSTKRLSLIKLAVPKRATGRNAMEQKRSRHEHALRGIGEQCAVDRGDRAAAWPARAGRFLRGVRGNEPRTAGRYPRGRNSLTILNRKRVFDYAGERHIPALYEYDYLARDGGLMSYGPDLKESSRRAADLVAGIFEGRRPAELPFEQPTRYPFVINLKTAEATGIELPPSLVALADEVIE